MLMNIHKPALALALALFSLQGFAQSIPLLNVSPDAAVSGMAATGVAAGASAWSMDNNFAAAAGHDGLAAAGVGYGLWQPSATKAGLLSASGFVKLGKEGRMALGLSYKGFSYDSYTVMNPEGQAGRSSFTPKENSVGLGFACKLGKGLSAGLGLKMASSSLAEDAKASAFGADISLSYTKEAFQAGLSVANLGTKLDYGASSYSLPSIVRAGAAYDFGGADSQSRLRAAAEFDLLFDSGMGAGLGLEYSFKSLAFLRAGYHYGSGDNALPSFASLGLGLAFADFHLDVSYLLASETLGGTLQLNLSYEF